MVAIGSRRGLGPESGTESVLDGFEEVVDGEWFFEGGFNAEESGDFEHFVGQRPAGDGNEREMGQTFAEVGEGFDAFASGHEDVDDGQFDRDGCLEDLAEAIFAVLGEGNYVTRRQKGLLQ